MPTSGGVLMSDPRFAQIDAMDGVSFEHAILELLRRGGYEELERIGGYDKGADIVGTYDGERVAVQVKRHSSAVRIDAVRQVLDGMTRYGCSRGLVVTNSFFTEPAIECANVHGIELWDRRDLSEFVDGEAPDVDVTVCAECGRGVTKGVTEWCLARPSRYGGAVFCRAHQARRNRSA
jgi:predicted RecB family endonuclease